MYENEWWNVIISSTFAYYYYQKANNEGPLVSNIISQGLDLQAYVEYEYDMGAIQVGPIYHMFWFKQDQSK